MVTECSTVVSCCFFFLLVNSLTELEKEMNQLRSGLKAVEKELEYHRTQSNATTAGDRFVPAVKEFMASATYRFSELEDKFQDMKNRVSVVYSFLLKVGLYKAKDTDWLMFFFFGLV